MTHIVTDSAKLLVKLQGQGSRTIDIPGDRFTIGRKAENNLPIDDHTVSGQHARIVKVQSVYFLEDLKSTNGTSVNGRRVERHQLRDADVITIGKHRIVFQEPTPPSDIPTTASTDLDQTMVIGTKDAAVQYQAAQATVLVTRGKTDHLEYQLTRPMSLIGSEEGAAIRLTGWFAPKSAAQIVQRGGAYFVGLSQGGKQVLVNGKEVAGQQQLKDGDQIQVAGIALTFYLRSGK